VASRGLFAVAELVKNELYTVDSQTKSALRSFFQKQTLYANIRINFGELKVKVSSRKYKQLAISGTGVFSFCNLLYNKHISDFFIHLTNRAYWRMVGKANQNYGYQYRYRHLRYF